MSTRTTSAGILVALVSAATFATSGPFAKSLLTTGWTPGSVVFLRIAVAAVVLLVPTVRALRGRWHLVRREWGQVVAFGLLAVALPQVSFFYAVGHLSVGVALMLEYLGLVLVVIWQSAVGRRLPGPATTLGVLLALVGLALVLDALSIWQSGGVRIDGIGVAWGLLAAVGLASYFLMSGRTHDTALPPLALAGGGLVVGALAFAALGATGVLPMEFHAYPAQLNGFSFPWWAAVLELGVIAGATPYVTGITATRVLGSKLASFVGLSEVLFTVLLAWLLLGELPRAIQLVGGLFILAGVAVVRAEESRPVRIGGRDSSDAGSATEANLAVAVPLRGQVPIVADDRVQGDGVDVSAAEDHRGVVGAVEQQSPL
ncbi:DMT family transporter [Marmoricola sp. URHB0036]|uniref:EamA family transporter n=1 Tax=Marmoricola sp. URHB0036 TaxID=1298863 RepID=UPI000419D148|nr:DMT family transporter [Marmoricola sp. URHB0036]